MIRNLSFELWLSIGEYSEKRDLNSLSRTAKQLANTLHPLLYRNVDLRRTECGRPTSPIKTLKLLSEDRRLAACVREIHIGDQCFKDDEDPYVVEPFLNALSNMTSLLTLYMDAYLESDSLNIILSILQSKERPICSFSIKQWTDIGYLTDESCFLHGMETFECLLDIHQPLHYDHKLFEKLFRFAMTSKETLHTLKLPLNVDGDEDLSYTLWELRFPNLKQLTVNNWGAWPGEIDSQNVSLRNFLLAHPNLLISVLEESCSMFSSAKFTGHQGRLRIASLAMTPCTMTEVTSGLTAEPDVFVTLHTLELLIQKGRDVNYTGHYRPRITMAPYFTWDLVRLAAVLSHEENDNGTGPLFRSIQHLGFAYKSEDKDHLQDEVVKGIHEFGQHCGSELRTITVSLPLLIFSEDELASAFDAYPQVEEITIRGGLLQHHWSEENYESTTKAIGLRCPNLKKLNIMRGL